MSYDSSSLSSQSQAPSAATYSSLNELFPDSSYYQEDKYPAPQAKQDSIAKLGSNASSPSLMSYAGQVNDDENQKSQAGRGQKSINSSLNELFPDSSYFGDSSF